jgi:RNA polymerase sigma-70 factor (ECF subfamily)
MSAPTANRAERRPDDETALLSRVRVGDRAAFETLVERHHGSLVRLAGMFVSTRSSAEDVAQESWVAVLDGIGAFEGRSSIKTWLFRIVVNRAKTRGVREARSLPFSALGDAEDDDLPSPVEGRFEEAGMWADPPVPWQAETPEELLSRREVAGVLTAALEDLPPKYRAIVTMRDVEELTPVEVCNILEISESNQRVLLHRARARLRQALEQALRGA